MLQAALTEMERAVSFPSTKAAPRTAKGSRRNARKSEPIGGTAVAHRSPEIVAETHARLSSRHL